MNRPYQALYHEITRGGTEDGQPVQYQAREIWWQVFCACVSHRPLLDSIRMADAAMRETGLRAVNGRWELSCDGNHAAPECDDSECWRRDPPDLGHGRGHCTCDGCPALCEGSMLDEPGRCRACCGFPPNAEEDDADKQEDP